MPTWMHERRGDLSSTLFEQLLRWRQSRPSRLRRGRLTRRISLRPYSWSEVGTASTTAASVAITESGEAGTQGARPTVIWHRTFISAGVLNTHIALSRQADRRPRLRPCVGAIIRKGFATPYDGLTRMTGFGVVGIGRSVPVGWREAAPVRWPPASVLAVFSAAGQHGGV